MPLHTEQLLREDAIRIRTSLPVGDQNNNVAADEHHLLSHDDIPTRHNRMLDQLDELGETDEPDEIANAIEDGGVNSNDETRRSRPVQCLRPASQEGQTGAPELDWRGLEYVGHYDEHLDCAICQSPLIEPKMAKCLHSFCRECFEQMLLEDDRCPLDRKPFEPFQDSPNPVFFCSAPPMVTSLLDNLRVRCPNARCDYVCGRSLIEHHFTKDCLYTRVPCPDRTCRKLVARHATKGGRCMHKLIECDYCSRPVELAGLEDHYDTGCEQNQIVCQSCLTAIPKHRYGTHVANCPDRLVDCQYKTSGCTAVIKKKDSVEHERTCLHGMIVRMQRLHDSDMEAMKATLNESRNQVQRLEYELAARPPVGQEWALPVPPTQPHMGTGGLGTPPVPLSQPTLQPLVPVTSVSPQSAIYGAVPGGPVMANGSGDQPGTPPNDANTRQTDGLNGDDKINHLLTDLEAFNARMEILERFVGGVDTRHALHTMNELAPIREQIVDLYNNLGLMNMHVRRMTESFRQTMIKSGGEVGDAHTPSAGSAATAMNTMAAAMALKQDAERRSFYNGPIFPGRRLSDRGNPPRL
ncbi:traf-like signal protein [Grosmannia clavigera kw1407]|uniref:Traf-like signal protein n=1 Tax=Grosmannia clavigera (strain kw1407 / UAMH 11150) TaxID=655863 RepID=F0X6P8_GROCL|nr:traf-like signal protein [Grosmannia clavigera kw1407]EFX06620.1 traf-like signal protein [Grosmannia clavigera kw1407]